MLDDIKKPVSKSKEEPVAPVAEQDMPSEEVETINEADLEKPTPTAAPKGSKNSWWHKFHSKWQSFNRRQKITYGSGAAVLLAVIVFGAFFLLHKPPGSLKATAINPIGPAKITTVASPLTGLQVSPDLIKRPVTAIMIENSTDARPQSGLQDAGVVLEAIAEGGITRFMALFQDTRPQYIGPVRSLRPYYIDFADPFQASIVHVGGSPDALAQVRNGNYRDLDQFFNADYFSRINARPAPHNVYTSFGQLDKLNQSKGYTSSSYVSWLRKADKKLAVPTAKTIDFTISSDLFHTHYDYDAATNSYARSEGGAPHMDLVSASDTTGVQLKPKVVIALVMNYSIAADGQHSIYGDIGSGTAYIFQDGGVSVGQWDKATQGTQLSFKDSGGNPIRLNAGQTWISLVADDTQVTYAP